VKGKLEARSEKLKLVSRRRLGGRVWSSIESLSKGLLLDAKPWFSVAARRASRSRTRSAKAAVSAVLL
jgi:hypothetical protein